MLAMFSINIDLTKTKDLSANEGSSKGNFTPCTPSELGQTPFNLVDESLFEARLDSTTSQQAEFEVVVDPQLSEALANVKLQIASGQQVAHIVPIAADQPAVQASTARAKRPAKNAKAAKAAKDAKDVRIAAARLKAAQAVEVYEAAKAEFEAKYPTRSDAVQSAKAQEKSFNQSKPFQV